MSDIAVVFYKIVKHHSKCLICGSPNTQFHHVCPKQKLSEVFRVASNGDLFACMEELNKCVPLCDPHHRGVHKGTIPGWLDGKHDNGTTSQAFAARQHMPYLGHFARRHPQVVLQFYRDYIEREHLAIAPLLSALGQDIPKNLRMGIVRGNNVQTGPSIYRAS